MHPVGNEGGLLSLKARTHRPIFTGSAEESAIKSADFTAQSADSMADFLIVGRLALSNMFNILNPLVPSADSNSRLQFIKSDTVNVDIFAQVNIHAFSL